MGIQGLLPMLKSIQKPTNLQNFAGKTLAVDAYGWLHRGTTSCAVELATGKPTRKFIDFAMGRVRMLVHFGVTPYIVFDGDFLPSKAVTEKGRRQRREDSKVLGMELLNAGKAAQAHAELQKAVDVTPEMARMFIDELKKAKVRYLVAPYEADPQMVYLEREGIVDGILSEDSDILVFGAKCLLTKLDQYGSCIEINRKDFSACKEMSLVGWTDREFRHMAILSGCDYLDNIPGMGLKTAYRMVRKHKTIEKVVRMLQFDGKYSVPRTYLDSFYRAELTFLHQLVYNPSARCLEHYSKPVNPLDDQQTQYIGAMVEPEIAERVASGELNPMTKLPIHTARSVLPRMLSADNRSFVRSTPQSTLRRVTSMCDLKSPGPMDSYLKQSKRVPLAEMSANEFTPSPSQRAAFARSGGEMVMDENSPIGQIVTGNSIIADYEPTVSLISGPRPNGHFTSSTTPVSLVRPPKRSRLCGDDSSVGTPGKGVTVISGHSRYFQTCAADPSPSMNRQTRHAVREISVYADDAAEHETESGVYVDEGDILDLVHDKPVPVVSSKAPGQHVLTPASRAQPAALPTPPDSGTRSEIDMASTWFTTRSGENRPFQAEVNDPNWFPRKGGMGHALEAKLNRKPDTYNVRRTPSELKDNKAFTASGMPILAAPPPNLKTHHAEALAKLTRSDKHWSLGSTPPRLTSFLCYKDSPIIPSKSTVEALPGLKASSSKTIGAKDIQVPCSDDIEHQMLAADGSEDAIIRDSEDEESDEETMRSAKLIHANFMARYRFTG